MGRESQQGKFAKNIGRSGKSKRIKAGLVEMDGVKGDHGIERPSYRRRR
jgi:hypothetical protein